MSCAGRGVTITELVVAMFIAMLIMSGAYMLFANSRDFLERPRASYVVQEDLMQLARYIQRDLAETNLMTVQSFPNAKQSAEPPGLVFESPRTSGQGQLQMGMYGAVAWQKFVYYTLVPTDGTVGNIVRREGPLSDQPSPPDPGLLMPMLSGKLPSGSDPNTSHVVAHNVVRPQVVISGMPPYDQYGGFKVTTGKPGGAFAALTGDALYDQPIRIDLAVREVSPRTGKTSVLQMRLEVAPRN